MSTRVGPFSREVGTVQDGSDSKLHVPSRGVNCRCAEGLWLERWHLPVGDKPNTSPMILGVELDPSYQRLFQTTRVSS